MSTNRTSSHTSTIKRRIPRTIAAFLAAFLAAASFATAAHATQELIAYWNFNTWDPDTETTIDADAGSGVIDLTSFGGTLDNFAGSTINALFGDPAGASLSLIAGTGLAGNGTWIDINLSMTNRRDLVVTFATRGTGTGFNSGTWSWSTDGINFEPVPSVNTATTLTNFIPAIVDLTGVDALTDAPSVTLRYTLDNAIGTSGNNRIDNLQLNATRLWTVQSDYFGERNAVAQTRTIRSMALSKDGTSVYTGYIQSPTGSGGTQALRRVSADVLAITGTDHVIFGNGMPGGSGGFGPVGGQPVYAGGATGTFEAWVGTGNTTSPRGLATDDRGFVYVALRDINTVRIYSDDLGTIESQITGVSSPTGVATLNDNGTYYAYVAHGNALQRWDVTTIFPPVLDSGWNPPIFSGAENLTVDDDGTVYLAGGGMVRRISADGTTVTHTVSIPNAADVAVFEDKAYVIRRVNPIDPGIKVFFKDDLTSAGPDIVVPDLGAPTFPRGSLAQFTAIDIAADGRIFVSEENYTADGNGIPSYTPPATSFNPTPGTITGRIYFDRVVVSAPLPVKLPLEVDVELPYLEPGDIERCIHFTLIDTGTGDFLELEETLLFTDGFASTTIDLPEPFSVDDFDCITARDPLHTLTRARPFVPGEEADFTSATGSALLGGDLNDDDIVDIIDFSIYVWQFGNDYGDASSGDTDCATPYPHADMTGSGMVEIADFTVLFAHFLMSGEACPAAASGPSRGAGGRLIHKPLGRISVAELRRSGLGHLAAADLSGDGVIDSVDMVLFLMGVRP